MAASKQCDNDQVTIETVFRNACEKNNLRMIKRLYDRANVNNKNEFIFHIACEKGHMDLAKWVCETFRIDVCADYNVAFHLACSSGNVDLFAWLCSLRKVGIDYNYLFKVASKKKHFGMMKCLQKMGANIHTDDDFAFRYMCRSGELNGARWTYSLGGVNIRAAEDYAFRFACANGCYEIAAWLCQLYAACLPNAKTIAYCFSWARHNGHLSIIELLISLKMVPNESKKDFVEAFVQVCNNGHYELGMWMYAMIDFNVDKHLRSRRIYVLNIISKKIIDTQKIITATKDKEIEEKEKANLLNAYNFFVDLIEDGALDDSTKIDDIYGSNFKAILKCNQKVGTNIPENLLKEIYAAIDN